MVNTKPGGGLLGSVIASRFLDIFGVSPSALQHSSTPTSQAKSIVNNREDISRDKSVNNASPSVPLETTSFEETPNTPPFQKKTHWSTETSSRLSVEPQKPGKTSSLWQDKTRTPSFTNQILYDKDSIPANTLGTLQEGYKKNSGKTVTHVNNKTSTLEASKNEKFYDLHPTLDLFKQSNDSNQSSNDCQKVHEHTTEPVEVSSLDDESTSEILRIRHAAQEWHHQTMNNNLDHVSKNICKKKSAETITSLKVCEFPKQSSFKEKDKDVLQATQNSTCIDAQNLTEISVVEKPKQDVPSGIIKHKLDLTGKISQSTQKASPVPKKFNRHELSVQSQTHVNCFLPETSNPDIEVKETEVKRAMISHLPVAVTIGSWTRYQDDDGHLYYYNSAEDKSQWEPPDAFIRDLTESEVYQYKEANKQLQEENNHLLLGQESLWNEIHQLKFSLENLLETHVEIIAENARLRHAQKSRTDRDRNMIEKSDMSRRLNRALTAAVCNLSPPRYTGKVESLSGKPRVFKSPGLFPGRVSDLLGFPDSSIKSEHIKIEDSGNSYIKREYKRALPKAKSHEKMGQHTRNSNFVDPKMVYPIKSTDYRNEDSRRRTKKRKREPSTFMKRKFHDPASLKRRRSEIKCKWGKSCKYLKCWYWHPKKVKPKRSLPIFSERKHECNQCGERFRFRESLKDHAHKHKGRLSDDKKYKRLKSSSKDVKHEEKKPPKAGRIVGCIVLDEEEEDRRAKRRIKFGQKELGELKDSDEETVDKNKELSKE